MPSVVFVPSSPLLPAEGLVGSVPEADELRSVALTTLRSGLVAAQRTDSASVVVLDADGVEDRGAEAGGSLRPHGLAVDAGGPERVLGLGHTVGAWLLDRAGWQGRRRYRNRLGPLEPDDVALVVADGSATRTERAPGHFDADAEQFDAELADALERGDPKVLGSLDLTVAERLWCRSAGTWVVAGRGLGDLIGDLSIEAHLTHAAAPCGVGWFVARWAWDGRSRGLGRT